MKKVFLALIILAIILTAGIMESVFIHKTFTTLDKKLNDATNLIFDDEDEALKQTKDAITWWEKQRKWIEILTFSPDIRGLSVGLVEAEAFLEGGNYADAYSKLSSMIVMANNIHHILDFNIEDII